MGIINWVMESLSNNDSFINKEQEKLDKFHDDYNINSMPENIELKIDDYKIAEMWHGFEFKVLRNFADGEWFSAMAMFCGMALTPVLASCNAIPMEPAEVVASIGALGLTGAGLFLRSKNLENKAMLSSLKAKECGRRAKNVISDYLEEKRSSSKIIKGNFGFGEISEDPENLIDENLGRKNVLTVDFSSKYDIETTNDQDECENECDGFTEKELHTFYDGDEMYLDGLDR